ncbi:unnamed protein product [Timema podura]|uniref:Mitochondrial GTPase 1 n=1 Tax=Timema podura TaxID=61482 RepID=A0ABN7NKP0_TIMPD|nr:unnamed protein product [Timema podura]
MGKGMKQMQQNLKSVDCVIEVHDARIPLSGRNPNFQYSVSSLKPHILVLNKKDLSDPKYNSEIERRLEQDKVSHVLYTNCKDQGCKGVKQLIPLATKLISSSQRYNRSEEKDYCMMVIGVPNVGKSSLINTLRNRHLHKSNAAHVGAVAGITRSVQNRIKVNEDPLIYLMDTPGVLTPNVPDVESGMRLALCACLQDHLVGEQIIADYLLYLMNKEQNFKYVEHLGVEQPSDHITSVLAQTAFKMRRTQRVRNLEGGYVIKPDLALAASHFIKLFRTGVFGPTMLDKDRYLVAGAGRWLYTLGQWSPNGGSHPDHRDIFKDLDTVAINRRNYAISVLGGQ